MSPALRNLPRYAEIARVLWRHGRELMSAASLPPELAAPSEDGGDAEGPERLALDLERLGPTFVKLGQLLSTRADLVPPRHLDALARLQDEVSPLPFETVEEVLRDELGVKTSKVFAELDADPVAAASLSQVHSARLRDGRRVAIKVQRPGVRQRVLADLELLEDMAGLLDDHWQALDLPALVGDLRRSLVRELDFQREASHLRRMAGFLERHRLLTVPLPIDDFTTSRVLTMRYVEGRKVTELHPLTRIDLDGERLAGALFHAYLESILVEGFFHADPHPGNILLTDDGRIALLDLGMTGELSRDFRERLLRLLLALSEGSGSQAADAAIRMGRAADDFDEPRFRSEVESLAQRLAHQTVERLQVGSVVLEVTRFASACGIRLPREFTLLGKTLLNLDQIGLALAPDFDPNAAIRRHAAEIAQGQMTDSLSPASWLTRLLDVKELVTALPERLNRLFETVADGRLRVSVDAIDEDLLITGFQKVANRIATGLVLAAMIVGAALVMQVPSEVELFGYPALAIVLFLAATVGGCALVWSIWRDDR